MYFAQLIFDTEDYQSEIGSSLVDADGNPLEDEDDIIDAIFDMSVTNPWLSEKFSEFLAQPSVFNFVAAVNGFYDNGGGKLTTTIIVKAIDCCDKVEDRWLSQKLREFLRQPRIGNGHVKDRINDVIFIL